MQPNINSVQLLPYIELDAGIINSVQLLPYIELDAGIYTSKHMD
jgi:hypothetical protein